MNHNEREVLIDQLDRSYQALPAWAKTACRHAMGPPPLNPETGAPFTSFKEILETAADHTLETLKEDFDDNGDLLPCKPTT